MVGKLLDQGPSQVVSQGARKLLDQGPSQVVSLGVIYEFPLVVMHEITLGWKGSVSFLHATGQGGLTLTPNTKEDTLLYPRIFSFQSTRFLGREGMNIKLYEVGILKGLAT